MNPFRLSAVALATTLLSACSVSEQTAETAAPTTAPNAVRTDADRRAIYNSNGTGSSNGYAVPDATPSHVRLGEQAAAINSAKRIENVNTNDANITTPETRLKRLSNDPLLPSAPQLTQPVTRP